jgi:hypothetical protein
MPPAPDRQFIDDLIEWQPRPVRLLAPLVREHCESAELEDLVAGLLLQLEPDGGRVDDDRAGDTLQVGVVTGRDQRAGEGVEAVLHVLAGHRIAVREARLRIETEGDRTPVRRDEHFFGQQAIHRLRLVGAEKGQRLDHEE